MLMNGWDDLLRTKFSDSDTVLAAINPRGKRGDNLFSNHAEGNWMALRCSFYQTRMPSWDGKPHGARRSLASET